MNKKKFRYFVGDFETTVYKGQTDTQVWASASVELFTEDVNIFHSIGEQFDYFANIPGNVCVYYHNLKFDGAFWLSYLLYDKGFTQAYTCTKELTAPDCDFEWQRDYDMPNNSFKYSISDMGQWYTISIKVHNKFIEIRDSLKLLPFALKKIGKDFKTKHQKLDMEYTGLRFPGCEITDDEKKYIANDVLVIKEALEIMFEQQHTKLTIGSCCLAEYRTIVGEGFYKGNFPDLTALELDKEKFGSSNADEYIRRSYKGGWCYLVKGKENQRKSNGVTADVNSLYPSMMSSESHNRYPVGYPTFWKGDFIPMEALGPHRYYFVRVRTRFYLKHNRLPCIQIKRNLLYNSTDWLETSDIYHRLTNTYSKSKLVDGEEVPATVELTLTMTDFQLIKEQYELIDFEILDGCWFIAKVGIFDDYIEKYKKLKLESVGALRQLAKLFLNNLYGKMAASNNSSFKVAIPKDDHVLRYVIINAFKKKVGYIPVGSAITSYARNFTIRAAQANYYGVDQPGFIYADTDSIHCDLAPEQLKNVPVHEKNFCCWKLECGWDEALFVRQKTYIEHVVKEDNEPIAKPYYSVKCAGMPEKCKKLFTNSMLHRPESEWITEHKEEWEKYTDQEKAFINNGYNLEDFHRGLIVPGKLVPRNIRGGILLTETTYEMR